MAPFYGWGLTALRLEPLQRGRLLFTTIVLWAGEIYWATSFCSYLPNIRLQKDKLSCQHFKKISQTLEDVEKNKKLMKIANIDR